MFVMKPKYCRGLQVYSYLIGIPLLPIERSRPHSNIPQTSQMSISSLESGTRCLPRSPKPKLLVHLPGNRPSQLGFREFGGATLRFERNIFFKFDTNWPRNQFSDMCQKSVKKSNCDKKVHILVKSYPIDL